MLKVLGDPAAPDDARIQGVRVARRLKTDEARAALLRVLADPSEAVAVESIRALAELGGDGVPAALLAAWKAYSAAARRAAVDALASRPAWAAALLQAVEDKTVSPLDVPAPVVRMLAQSGDATLRERVARVLGASRETPADKARLIAEKKLAVINGPVDFAAGRALAQKHCLTCHAFYGEGANVGPDLTGVGRESLDVLLTNIIDPNQVIGKGFEQVVVTTKDERLVSGRLTEDTPERLTLLSAGPKEETVARADVETVNVTPQSVMPEGLEQMPEEDFRNLVWYVFSPPQEKDARIRVEPRARHLVVRARPSEKDRWADLVTQVLDPSLRPYLHPVRDPSGQVVLTQDRPDDHPWQHGVFTGLHQVNGLDFWTEQQGKQRFVRLLDLHQTRDRAGWRSLTEWVAPDGTVLLEEEQTLTVHAPEGPNGYLIDFDWLLRAKAHEVAIGRHDYGGLSVRMAFDSKRRHLNANGERDGNTAAKRAAWCNVARAFGEDVFGIAVFDHPGNAKHPAAWRVDGQGMINPSPSLSGRWSIPEGGEKRFRYRLLVHRGAGDAAVLGRTFDRFAAE
jgi:putative heme-binding domain-containing protein